MIGDASASPSWRACSRSSRPACCRSCRWCSRARRRSIASARWRSPPASPSRSRSIGLFVATVGFAIGLDAEFFRAVRRFSWSRSGAVLLAAGAAGAARGRRRSARQLERAAAWRRAGRSRRPVPARPASRRGLGALRRPDHRRGLAARRARGETRRGRRSPCSSSASAQPCRSPSLGFLSREVLLGWRNRLPRAGSGLRARSACC